MGQIARRRLRPQSPTRHGHPRLTPSDRGRPARPATIHLIRHAEHVLQGKALVGRQPGIALSKIGQAQAARLADIFSTKPLSAVWSSPLDRALATAAAIAAPHGLSVETIPGLNEIDFGAWTGLTFEALHGAEWDAWNTARGTAPTPSGETMLVVQARAVAALCRAEGEVAVVSHQDVLKSILAWALGLPLDNLHRFELLPASRSVLTIGRGWTRVQSINL